MHSALVAIRSAIQGTPWEGKLYLVGGAVRDALLGREEGSDLDLVLEGDALAVARHLWASGVATMAPVEYPRFGTAMVRVGSACVELVTARAESYEAHSRKPHVSPSTLGQDALRRDFTVNALYRRLSDGELLDPTGQGVEDLQAGLLRTPVPPEQTFFDDPLRMLRAVRLRWTLGFDYVPELEEALRSESPRLGIVSMERIRDEFTKMILLGDADLCLRDLLRLGLLEQFAPELVELVGVEQGQWHHLDAWDHTLLVLRQAGSKDPVLALSCLLHDVGKSRTRTVDERGQARFFGHEVLGEQLSRAMLTRLRYPSATIESVAKLVKGHMRLHSAPQLSDTAIRRLLRDFGPAWTTLLDLVQADVRSLKPGVSALDVDALRTRIAEMGARTPPQALESPLSGAEIMAEWGLDPGPLVGQIKQVLLEAVLEGKLEPGDRLKARELAQEYLRNHGHEPSV